MGWGEENGVLGWWGVLLGVGCGSGFSWVGSSFGIESRCRWAMELRCGFGRISGVGRFPSRAFSFDLLFGGGS